MKNKLMILGTVLMLATKAAFADDSASNNSADFYRANELSVDAFGTATLGKYSIEHISNARVRHNTRLGVGIGMSYFITKNIGFGADAYSENTSGAFVDSASANVILRFPLGESRFAPYAFGGGGHQWDMAKLWFAQVGAGIECRLAPNVGLFMDGRWVLPDETKYYGVGRLGVRFSF